MGSNTSRNLARFQRRSAKLTMTRVTMFGTLLVAMVIGVLGFFTYEQTMGSQNPQLKGILSRVNQFGQLVDPANEINVNSAADVGYKYKGKTLSIIYGNVTIDLPFKKIDENTLQQLLRIGVSLEDADDKARPYIVIYRGVEVNEFR